MAHGLVNAAQTPVPISLVRAEEFASWSEHRPRWRAWLKATGFTPTPGATALLPGSDGDLEGALVCVQESPDTWSLAGFAETAPAQSYYLEGSFSDVVASRLALGWALADYTYAQFKARARLKPSLVWPRGADRGEVIRIAEATECARDWINTPAESLGPRELAAIAENVARGEGADFTLIEGAALAAGYPMIEAVGRASTRAPLLIDFRWGRPDAPRVTLVGKGVCFDTGGLDIKTAEGMLTMKADMGGAAVVLGLAQMVMSAELPIRLRVMVPAVDNAIAGNAIRPLDVVRTRLGKTVEIGNTDAEGRLILCDAIADADDESPSLLIDCATLTNAARIALGPDLQALYCDDDAVAEAMLSASVAVDDPLWRMPLWRPYQKMIEGKSADLNNIAQKPQGASIVAGIFLAEFVSKSAAWAHLDIYATNPTARPGRPEGGEATGMRALYHYLKQRYGSPGCSPTK